MNDRDLRRYNRLTAVQTFGKINAADFTAGGAARAHFAELDALLKKLDDAKAGQNPNRVSKATLLDALELDFRNIARTARAIDYREPGFATAYRVPDNLTEATVLTHADMLLTRLDDDAGDTPAQQAAKTALRLKFADYELPANFAARLRADRDALLAARQNNQAETLGGVENTAALSELLGEGQTIVQQLDAAMHNKYDRQPQKLREWQSASHVERSPERAAAAAHTAIATPPATTPPATT